jgi:hypothetical protein
VQTFPRSGLGTLRLGIRRGHEGALLGPAVPYDAGAMVHFTDCIDPNLTGVPVAWSGALARSWCWLGRRGDRAGRARTR